MPFVPFDPSKDFKYDPVDPTKIARVEIFPPVGIARVGNSGADENGQPDPKHEIEYYYGPEVPGIDDVRFGTFRDSNHGIKRQAARFRVYAYGADGKVLGEINNSQQYELTWTVHVANKKAAYYLFRGILNDHNKDLRNPDIDRVNDKELSGEPFDQSLEGRKRLIIDPGPQTITHSISNPGMNVPIKGKFQGSRSESEAVTVSLGELRTDSHGRLVFLGGSGHARSVQPPGFRSEYPEKPEIISEFDSLDWYDDVCDGWVDVSVSHPNRRNLDKEVQKPRKATVISAPPDFAWGIDSPTSLYDIIENIYRNKYVDHAKTNFYKDIWPVVSGTYKLSWVNEKAFQGHGPGAFGYFWDKEEVLSSSSSEASRVLREHIFDRLRKPNFSDADQAKVKYMPRLSGDDGDAIEPGVVPSTIPSKPIQLFAALTELQHDRFHNWKDGNFDKGQPFKKHAIEEYDKQEQPAMLTRAMLEQTIGDPLYPGIETFWIGKLEKTYDTKVIPGHLHPPFRVNHEVVSPGFLSRGLSLPWHSDFSSCNTHWWPSARPDDVVNLQAVGASHEPSLIPRHRWSEGLRDTPADVSTAFFPGSTDMVRLWTQLGFVAKAPPTGIMKAPMWIEQERLLPLGFVPQALTRTAGRKVVA